MLKPLIISLYVGGGGFAGSLARYGLSIAGQRVSVDWPLGTLAANACGCLMIGVVTALSAQGEVLSPELRLGLATGFCGSFTTMSSMIYETSAMMRAGEYFHATVYAAGTFLISMAAFVVGVVLMRLVFRIAGG